MSLGILREVQGGDVTTPSEEPLVPTQTNHADELVPVVYRTQGDRDQSMSAAKKAAAFANDKSSLLFHRKELLKPGPSML